MENFLESSTIHGLIYISTTRKYVRLFWILAVLAGFIVASLMIYQSFQSWNESPIKTAIETQPIAEIHYPKVTVCPPKKTYTDLNYDIMMIRNMTLDNATRDELTNYAVMLLYEHLYNTSMTNLNKLEDNDRYYNWYHGYSKIRLPFHSSGASFFSSSPTLYYYVNTYAKSGTISTQNYGKKFDADNVDTDIQFDVNVYPPEDVTLIMMITMNAIKIMIIMEIMEKMEIMEIVDRVEIIEIMKIKIQFCILTFIKLQ